MNLATDEEYIPRDDESEAARIKDSRGDGEIIYIDDEEVRQYSMEDFGLFGPGKL